MNFDVGQVVYWVRVHKPPGKAAALFVDCGRYVFGDRRGNMVLDVSGFPDSVGPARPANGLHYVFPDTDVTCDPAKAYAWALGQAARLLIHFGYSSVTVHTRDGRVVELPAAMTPTPETPK
jgi:hypothetical protein